MDALLAAIVTWLSINFGLVEDYELPKIRFLSTETMSLVQYPELNTEERRTMMEAESLLPVEDRRSVVAAYDTRHQEILLPDGWEGRSPAEISMLVHEMVHHLQWKAGTRYACPAEREGLAYEAQDRWLAVFGTTLEREFQIDGMTLLVSTTCGM